MRHYFRFLFSVAMVLSMGTICAQNVMEVAIGDTATLISSNEGVKYAWSVSTDNKTYYTLPAETNRVLKVRVFGENYYRVRWTDANKKSYYADTVKIVTPSVAFALNNYPITAGQGYVEENGTSGSGISIPSEDKVAGNDNKLAVTKKLTNWTNSKAHAVYYFNTPAGVADLKMNITASKNATLRFRLRVFDTDTPDSLVAEKIISFCGTGVAQTIPMLTCKFGKPGYNKYDLECLWGCTSITSINKWQFDLEENAEPYSPTILMAPSIHIWGWSSTNPKCPTGQAFDWAYEEVMIPRSDSLADATYVMSLGVLAGYMGIQVGNHGRNRTVLFSQWDSGDTDIDPNLPDHLRSTAVDTGDSVVAKRFGAEGTGIQSFRTDGAFWDFEKYVQFITHCRNELATYEVKEGDSIITKQQRNMIVSAWWNAQDEKGWQYISTLRVANRDSYIDSWYSFVENYSNHNGQVKRHGYFRNGYVKERSGSKKWYHMNKISFGHNNGGTHMGARNDIWQDVDPNDKYAFKMSTGGFANKAHLGRQSVTLRSKNTPVDTIDIASLLAREELALAREQARLDSMKVINESMYDRSKWKLISFSSEETTGEKTNGRAAQILDGDKNTYWHSRWQSSVAQLPHTFVIDMSEPVDINAFYFAMSGGVERFQKEILIEGSLDNEQWFDVYENNNCPTPKYGYDTGEYVLRMDSTANARYLRLTIKSVYTGVVYARINEFGVLNLPAPTSIDDNIVADEGDARIYTVGNCIYIDAPKTMEYANIDVYSIEGKKLLAHKVDDVKEGDVISIHSFSLVPGIYAVRVESAEGNIYTSKVVIK